MVTTTPSRNGLPGWLKAALTGCLLSIPISAAIILLFFSMNGPSTAELDADIQAVGADLKSAEDEAAQYTGGVILALIKLRQETLQNTKVMLQQKRSSMLRGIRLNYSVDGDKPSLMRPDKIEALEKDVAAAQREVADAEREAAKYSGGLLQSLALMRAETARLSVAQLKAALLLARNGIPAFVMPDQKASAPPEPLKGPVVEDKNAL